MYNGAVGDRVKIEEQARVLSWKSLKVNERLLLLDSSQPWEVFEEVNTVRAVMQGINNVAAVWREEIGGSETEPLYTFVYNVVVEVRQ